MEISKEKKNTFEMIGLKQIKSDFILKDKIFLYLYENRRYNMIKYNKKYQKKFGIDIENYKEVSGRYKEDGINGNGKEYLLGTEIDILVFEGKYLNNKKHEINI